MSLEASLREASSLLTLAAAGSAARPGGLTGRAG
jgi:hypothetical protein